MVSAIVNGTVNETFLESIVALGSKLKFLKSSSAGADGSFPSESYAGRALLPELGRLKLKAIVKSKDYFAQQFNALRKPKTNVQMLQQNSLVKYAPLYHFLSREAPSFSEELKYVPFPFSVPFFSFNNLNTHLAKYVSVSVLGMPI